MFGEKAVGASSLPGLSGDTMAARDLEARKGAPILPCGDSGISMSADTRFWKTKTLAEMSAAEWESLCDGCGKCCTVLLRDEETGAVYETDVACRLYDPQTRRCVDYARRHRRVKDCVRMDAASVPALDWMPPTCAYRLVARGADLPEWHPLVAGDRQAVIRAGAAAPTALLNERDVPASELEDHVTGVRSPV